MSFKHLKRLQSTKSDSKPKGTALLNHLSTSENYSLIQRFKHHLSSTLKKKQYQRATDVLQFRTA